MSLKTIFAKIGKGIWHGIRASEPYLQLAGALLPPPFGTALSMLDDLINQAELKFPADGTGPQKAQFVADTFLQGMELLTGKNVDNPSTRAIVSQINDVAVETKNLLTQVKVLEGQYADLAKSLKAAIDSIKDPAIPDAPQP